MIVIHQALAIAVEKLDIPFQLPVLRKAPVQLYRPLVARGAQVVVHHHSQSVFTYFLQDIQFPVTVIFSHVGVVVILAAFWDAVPWAEGDIGVSGTENKIGSNAVPTAGKRLGPARWIDG